MKKEFLVNLMIIFFLSLTSLISGQITTTWTGGTPGRSTDWNCPSNWKEGRVPDEFCQVIIPSDRNFYPVINAEVAPIDALLVESGAKITIQRESTLTVLGGTGRMNGATLFGEVINDGVLEFAFQSDKDKQYQPNITLLVENHN